MAQDMLIFLHTITKVEVSWRNLIWCIYLFRIKIILLRQVPAAPMVTRLTKDQSLYGTTPSPPTILGKTKHRIIAWQEPRQASCLPLWDQCHLLHRIAPRCLCHAKINWLVLVQRQELTLKQSCEVRWGVCVCYCLAVDRVANLVVGDSHPRLPRYGNAAIRQFFKKHRYRDTFVYNNYPKICRNQWLYETWQFSNTNKVSETWKMHYKSVWCMKLPKNRTGHIWADPLLGYLEKKLCFSFLCTCKYNSCIWNSESNMSSTSCTCICNMNNKGPISDTIFWHVLK
jgi:hypothetical protein